MKHLLFSQAESSLKNAAKEAAGGNSISIDGFLDKFVNVFIYIIGAVAVLALLVGAIRYAVSGGDSKATEDAKNTIVYALIGLAVAAAAYAMVRFVIGKL